MAAGSFHTYEVYVLTDLSQAAYTAQYIDVAGQLIAQSMQAPFVAVVACPNRTTVGTAVDTPGGLQAIQTLRVGDRVLAEDPTTGVIASEHVQAVITVGVKPLMAVTLSDGNVITETRNHPFWVDSGAAFAGHRVAVLTSEGRMLLTECRLQDTLPQDAFVFYMHQGDEFGYFRIGDGADPPVYQYVEGSSVPKLVGPRFTAYLIDMHTEPARTA